MKTHHERRSYVLCLLGAANGRSTGVGVTDAVERMRAIVDASAASSTGGGFNKDDDDADLNQDGWRRCGFNAGDARNGVMFAARAWGCGPVGCFERTEGWIRSCGDESDALRDVLVDAAFEAERGGDASDASGTASAAANGAIGLLESCGLDETTVELVDVVWFETPGCGSSRSDGEEEAVAYSDDANAWTDEMVAAYGTFRRAVELFGDAVRLRVVSCDVTGKCSRAALAVAEACGASVSSLDEDETVDLGVRFRGSLGFASADGTERVEICRLSASRFDEKEVDAEGTLASSSSSNTKTKRGDDAWRPMARALRVVEIARVGEVPGLYLSSDVDLCVRVDERGDGTLKDEFFSAWRSACARASSWADVPALVVKSQTRLETNRAAGLGARRYRDLTRDEGVSTPMLMYPVVRKSETTTTTYLEFRLRPFVSTATLIGRLSKSAGAGGLTRVNVAMDHMSDLARYQALEEAEMALLRLSERKNVTLRDVEELDDDENAFAETITAPTSPTRPNASADFSPDIGGIKSASSSLKLLSAVNAAARGASVKTEDNLSSAPRIAYAKMWRQSVEAEASAAFVRAETMTPSTTQSSVKFDEIFDRLTERNDVGRKRTLARDTTEGYYTKAFNEAVDISLAQLAQIGASTTLLKKFDDDGERAATATTAEEEKSFQAIVCCETDAAKEKRRAERRRMHEEKREKMFLALGVDPRAVKRRSSLDGDSTKSAAAAAAAAVPPLPVVTASPQPPVIVSSSSKKPLADANDAFACPKCDGALNRPADGSRLNFCYMCGFKL
jgi:hypothetical protein